MSSLDYNFYEDGEGKMRVVLKGGRQVCDFCLAPDPPWTYPCGVVPITGYSVINISDDDWGACEACRELIEADDLHGLAERMAVFQPVHAPPDASHVYPPLKIRRRIALINAEAFFAARSGPAVRDTYPPTEA